MQPAIDDIAFQATPEPSIITLLASGFVAFGGFHFFRRRRAASEAGLAR
jgi:predicted transporter